MVIASVFRKRSWGEFPLFLLCVSSFSRAEFFQTVHLFYVCVYALVFIHYPTAILLCFPAAVLHFVDVILRKLGGRDARIVSAVNDGEAMLTRIDIAVPSFRGKVVMGQFLVRLSCFALVFFFFLLLQVLRIPALERVPIEQLHPFSIAHYNKEESVVSLFVRDMGRDTFTGQLAQRAKDLPSLGVQIEGPYGSLQLSPHEADTVVSISSCFRHLS